MPSNNYEKEIRKILDDDFQYKQGRKYGYEGKKLSESQKQTLKEWKEYYELKPSPKGGTTKPASVFNSLMTLRLVGLELGKPYKEVTQKDILRFFKKQSNKADSTISSWKINVRFFYKWLYGIREKHAFPEVVDHELLRPQRPKPSVNRSPDHFLSQDEIKKMLENCYTFRDKVLVMLTYGEGSLRSGEIVSLNFGSVDFNHNSCKLWIRKSKSKERSLILIDTFPYLRDYLNHEYTLEKNLTNPLFYGHASLNYKNRLETGAVSGALKRIAMRAGITKNVFAHMGRHQAITNWARAGLSLPLNAKRAGITTSTLERVYLHHDDKDVEDAILAIKGGLSDEDKMLKEEEKKKLSPKRCVRCEKINPATALTCHCGAYLDLKLAEEAEQKRTEMDKLLIEGLLKDRIEEMTTKFIESGEAIKLLKKVINK